MARKKYPESDRAEAVENLRRWLKPGDRVYCVLRSVARSGMSRKIALFVVVPATPNGVRKHTLWNITHNAATALGYTLDHRQNGIVVGGCGMDMGFAVVHDLGRAVFRGKKITPSMRTKARTIGTSDDPGYLLNHHWM